MRLRLKTTSSAVSVEPSWNFTPLRSWTFQTVADLFDEKPTASRLTIAPFGA